MSLFIKLQMVMGLAGLIAVTAGYFIHPYLGAIIFAIGVFVAWKVKENG